MAWRIEFAPDAVADQRRLFRHLLDTHHRNFGRPLREARDKASHRVRAVRTNTLRIAAAPHIGTSHAHAGETYRHVTIERAIYWFTLDGAAQIVRIEAIFYGGQDHVARMLDRLSARSEGDA